MFDDQRASIISGWWCSFTILKKIMEFVNGVGMTSHIYIYEMENKNYV